MKLDTKSFRYLSQEDWRVLTAVELGTKNHEVVPTSLISQISALRTGLNGCQKCISTLAKDGLVARVQNAKYDGYRLTYGGYDYLALRTLTKNGSVIHLGNQMGVGKESDIYLVTSPSKSAVDGPEALPQTATNAPVQSILKIHRLGRTSFRTIRTNRAYHGSRAHCSWQYLSRLSAVKEYAAMCALHAAGFPVPEPIAQNRHTIVMSLVPGLPLRQVPLSLFRGSTEQIATLYGELMELILRLAGVGLIHGDFNEFNILLCNLPEPDEGDGHSAPPPADLSTNSPVPPITPHLIDFPQITSLAHPQAAAYFARDVACIKAFFRKRYHFTADHESGPTFEDAQQRLEETLKSRREPRLDIAIEAAGFNRKMARELDRYYEERRTEEDGSDENLDNGAAGDVESDALEPTSFNLDDENEGIHTDVSSAEDAGRYHETEFGGSLASEASNDGMASELNVSQAELDLERLPESVAKLDAATDNQQLAGCDQKQEQRQESSSGLHMETADTRILSVTGSSSQSQESLLLKTISTPDTKFSASVPKNSAKVRAGWSI